MIIRKRKKVVYSACGGCQGSSSDNTTLPPW